jgi:transposase-like protein
MSSKKITDADKLEIVDLYRQSGDTTASLASRYGVSNSTISRLLKTSIPEAEYEVLIQQKRGSKASSEAELIPSGDSSASSQVGIPSQPEHSTASSQVEIPNLDIPSPSDLPASNPELDTLVPTQLESSTAFDEILADPIVSKFESADRDNAIEDSSVNSRRVRRRSSAPESQQTSGAVAQIDKPMSATTSINTPVETSAVATKDIGDDIGDDIDTLETAAPKTPISPPITRTPVLREILADSKDRYANPPPPPAPPVEISTDESDEDNEPEDVNLLAAMFGEEIADGDDDDDDADAEDWDEESPSSPYQQLDGDRLLTEDRLHVQVKPLSQATLPRTCYIVIDKFAELIVRPLKDFADLGQLPDKETQQRTLPVFDNHRVAKRFSNQRTQRVIKVPDSRIFHKTTQHLRSKGITCLLVDGNIYSLN